MKLETQNSTFKIPLGRQQMADYLNVERSALSKEFKMKSEGLIDYHKNTFHCLLYLILTGTKPSLVNNL